MAEPVQQSQRIQRRNAATMQSGQLQRASRNEKRGGHSYEASLYHDQAQKLVKLAYPLTDSEKKASKAAGY